MSKLLIVDDEIDIREFAKSFFKKRGIEVFIASGGKEALEIILAEQPNLVLLDVRMEQMSGVDVLKELRKNNKSTKVIMVSATEDEEIINEVKSLGVSGFVHKPLVLEELEQIVLAELNK